MNQASGKESSNVLLRWTGGRGICASECIFVHESEFGRSEHDTAKRGKMWESGRLFYFHMDY